MTIYFSKTLSFVSNLTSLDLKIITKTLRRKEYNASKAIENFKINGLALNTNIFPFDNNKMILVIIFNKKVIISFIPAHSNSKQSVLLFQPRYSYPQYSQ